ncbi:MAPEG family protein [Teredinibacter sp. KSP-S5-2]|uniref:MAPEG family protein n=1 Tax=Teredinibacter sp. KSP-S5-2 TaxID=3034506 RepID=UPI0029345966|nr:MAPEG family protein [Teredinibacter sp. KSP-S5-2]WNO11462.1 MAPEG family protein [Teredinibacter sp. KSP-S5-2]
MFTTIKITSLTASIVGILTLVLAYRVAYIRKYNSVQPGINGDLDFTVAFRAHANLVEYAPIFLILLAIAEFNQINSSLLIFVATAFTISRIAHAIGYTVNKGGKSALRSLGNSVTWIMLLLICLINLTGFI